MNKLTMFFLALLTGFASAGARSAVYQCTGDNGGKVFSDRPCDENSEPMKLGDPTFSAPSENSSVKARQEVKADKKNAKSTTRPQQKKKDPTSDEERARKAGERRFVREGMKASEVRASIGKPDRQEAGDCTAYVNPQNGGRKSRGNRCGRCWVYVPVEGDSQARTQVCFDSSQTVVSVRRVIER